MFMTVLYLLDVGDASGHIRVSFTFWGTAIIYYLFSFNKEAQARFGKYLLLLFCVTVITSTIGVFVDNSAARAIANASPKEDAIARDYELMRKNISSIYLFQSIVIFVPVTVMMLRYRRRPMAGAFLLVFIVLAVLKASFTISLLVLIAGGYLALISNRRVPVMIILTLCLVALVILPLDTIFELFAGVIPNHYISTRLEEIATFLSQRGAQGDLQLRMQCYQFSLHTFMEHPFGTGPWYSYIIGDHGIGFHSEILDDLARYGFAALVFYLFFFCEYFHLLRSQWMKINLSCVAFPVCASYFAFLLLNIGFRSGDESVFMLYILPAVPEILIQSRKRREVMIEKGAV